MNSSDAAATWSRKRWQPYLCTRILSKWVIHAMSRSDHRHFPPVFMVLMLVLGYFALAMAQNAANHNAGPPNVLNQIVSGQGRGMISRPATLAHATIQGMTQEDIIWVGSAPDRSVMVMLQPSVNPIDPQGNPTAIAAGDQVRVTGHVLRAPSVQVLESWGVSPADAARVQQQGVVLRAATLEVIRRNQ